MFEMIASELVMPWRAVEAMHWQMGAEEIAERAGERAFQTHPSSSKPRSPPPSTPGSSGGEASSSAMQQVGVTRSRRSSSITSNRRRAQSDVVARSERTAQLSALPAVSEATTNEATMPATADELYATPSPPSHHGGQSLEGSSTGNALTPQHEGDHRRSQSLASSAGLAKDQAAQPNLKKEPSL